MKVTMRGSLKPYFSKIYLILLGCSVCFGSRTNFSIKKYEVCYSLSHSPVMFHGNITNEGDKQYLNYNVILPFPIDENIGSTWLIEHSANGKLYLPIFTITENNACKAANKYVGELWYEFQRASQMQPRTCPIAPGRYQTYHYLLDFKNMALQTFPFGQLRFTMNAIDNRKKLSIFCVRVEVDNAN